MNVSWRGKLADLERLDAFEDALLEIAMEFDELNARLETVPTRWREAREANRD